MNNETNLLKMVADAPNGQDMLYELGNQAANTILTGLKNKTLKLEDEIVITFLPAILGGGNLEFLKACARCTYDDTRADVIVDFLDYILKLGEEGYTQIKNRMEM